MQIEKKEFLLKNVFYRPAEIVYLFFETITFTNESTF